MCSYYWNRHTLYCADGFFSLHFSGLTATSVVFVFLCSLIFFGDVSAKTLPTNMFNTVLWTPETFPV